MMHGFGGGRPGGGGPGGSGRGRGGGRWTLRRADEEELLGKIYDHRLVMRLLRYLAPYKGQVALAALSMVVYSFAALVGPYLLKMAIDRFIATGDLRGLDILALVYLANALLSWGAQYIQVITNAGIGYGALYTLRTSMFDHLQRLSLSFYDRNEVGRIMSRVQNDIGEVQELLSGGFLSLLSDLLSLVGIIAILLSMNMRLALLTLAVVPLMGVSLTIWQRFSRRAYRRVRQAISAVNADLQENISGVRVIQSLHREDMNLRRFDAVNEANLSANLTVARLTGLVGPMVEVVTALATALVIVVGGAWVLSAELSVGALVAFTMYIQRFFAPIRSLTGLYTELQRAITALERIFEIFDTKPEIQDAPQAKELASARGEMRFEGVSFAYDEGPEVLHDINLAVQPGETVALVGPTGAGKSTMALLLGRHYEVKQGAITLDGHDLRQVSLSSLRRHIAMVPQEPFLFSGTVRENVGYGKPSATDEEIAAAARLVGATAFIGSMEAGYDTDVEERGIKLSVGQRQLLCLARALLVDPAILILDEATASVDTQTEALIQQALRRLFAGRTAIVIAHRLSTVRDAHRIVVLDQGRIVDEGTHDELMRHGGLYAHLYQVSMREGKGFLVQERPPVSAAS